MTTTLGATTGEAVALEARLREFLADRLGSNDFVVRDLRPVGLGRSRDNWVFDLQHPADGSGGREELIVRCDPEGGLVDTSRETEFAVLLALADEPAPSPEARWLDADGAWFGRPALLMRRAAGACDYRVVNGTRPLSERVALARDFCDLLAQVHASDWRARGLGQTLPDPGPQAARHELDRWEAIFRQDRLEAWPELDLAFSVLRDSAPESTRTVVVHADFKPGNILLADNRIVALLDWELAHLGDPVEDLGWVTQPLRRAEHLIDGAWESTDLVTRYEDVTGTTVDPDHLRWWVTFSTLKTAVMQISGLRAFISGRSDQPYRPTRRVLATLLADVAALADPAVRRE